MKIPQSIKLKHHTIDNKRCIVIHFRSLRAVKILLQELEDYFEWDDELKVYYIFNELDNIDKVNKLIRTTTWINAKLYHVEVVNNKKAAKQKRGAA
ncbi:hypothetical protein [Algibacter aquimarinus]|uniref:Uncharacterized protein n=1 Tax=Algibacter aquimarinus TaxID=1136748 RepID=A0ABP9HMI9_9FLAO